MNRSIRHPEESAGEISMNIIAYRTLRPAPVSDAIEKTMLFGSGGRCGCYGAHLQQRPNERWIRQFLGLLVMALSLGYLSAPLSAQCIVDNPGGSKLNPSRPGDADVPASSFSPLASVNHSLPQWLCFAAGYRARLESYSAGNFRPGNSDSYLLTRFRLGMSIRPSHWPRPLSNYRMPLCCGSPLP